MIVKDTTVQFTLSQDNSDLDDFPNQFISQSMDYSGPTWVQMLEDIIKVLELHYGYPIRENIYYAMSFPVFDHNLSYAPGRELKKGLFLQLLKDNPELNNGGEHTPVNTDWE